MLSGFLLLPLIEVKIKQATLKTFLKKKKVKIFFFMWNLKMFFQKWGEKGDLTIQERGSRPSPQSPFTPHLAPTAPHLPLTHPHDTHQNVLIKEGGGQAGGNGI